MEKHIIIELKDKTKYTNLEGLGNNLETVEEIKEQLDKTGEYVFQPFVGEQITLKKSDIRAIRHTKSYTSTSYSPFGNSYKIRTHFLPDGAVNIHKKNSLGRIDSTLTLDSKTALQLARDILEKEAEREQIYNINQDKHENLRDIDEILSIAISQDWEIDATKSYTMIGFQNDRFKVMLHTIEGHYSIQDKETNKGIVHDVNSIDDGGYPEIFNMFYK
ncbi:MULTISPECIES: hypothetical protein [Bacillus cereus group]|uniref:Uncharacterized protein n=1 Tax=Bacillus thuringiensis TaxID=1428 RepID=A0A9X7AS17_BACTU|nr:MULTISPECIES: hypothetical protein [Bacillus cereus group]PEV64197.1 hypothetical protein CN434_25650 [Bacillus thuringiensis]PFT50776.1 hypothetical protein COK72_01875 [Bacillus thuringiensis]PFY22813.1 hypothetical protein COL44_18195 [Bacillus toyonensis]